MLLSPSIWWNKSELLDDELLAIYRQTEVPLNLFISMGSQEEEMLRNPILNLNEMTSEIDNKNFRYTFKEYEHRNHTSNLPSSIYDGFLLLYKRH